MVLTVNNASNLSNNELESSSPPRQTHREGSVTTSPSGQFSIKRLGTQAFILWMNAAAAICAMSRMSKAEAIPLNHTPSGKELSNLVNGLQDTNASHNHLSTHQNTSSIRTRLFPRQDPPPGENIPKLTGHEAPACIPRTPSPGKPDPKYLSKAELAGITAGAIAGAAAVVALAGGTAAHFVRRNRHGGGDGGV